MKGIHTRNIRNTKRQIAQHCNRCWRGITKCCLTLNTPSTLMEFQYRFIRTFDVQIRFVL